MKKVDESGNPLAGCIFIVLRDGLDRGSMVELEEAIEALPGITSMVAYDKLLPSGIPDFFIPQDIKKLCKQEGYQMLMVNSGYVTASVDEDGILTALEHFGLL